MLQTDKGFKAVEVNSDSYWLRSRKEKHLTASLSWALKWGFPRGRPADAGILASACWSAAFKGEEPSILHWLGSGPAGLQCLYICRVLQRKTWHTSDFRVRRNSQVMKIFGRKGNEVGSFEGGGKKEREKGKCEDRSLNTTCCRSSYGAYLHILPGLQHQFEIPLCLTQEKSSSPFSRSLRILRLVWACCISGKAFSHWSEVSSFSSPHLVYCF